MHTWHVIRKSNAMRSKQRMTALQCTLFLKIRPSRLVSYTRLWVLYEKGRQNGEAIG